MIKIGLIVLCAYNVTVAQSQQVTMEIVMVFDIPYVGPINRQQKIIFGPNMRHSVETTKAERFYARMFVNESKGKIIDNNSNNYWKYDIEDKEYWAVPFEKALYMMFEGNLKQLPQYLAAQKRLNFTFRSEFDFGK